MPQTPEIAPSEPLQAPAVVFADAPRLEPCSFNECKDGHRWAPIVTLAQCGGCAGPLLAVQKTNCPFCNEPTLRTVLRSDFIPRGAGVAKRCQGQVPYGESIDLEMERVQWREVEGAQMKLFEEKATA